MRHTVVLSDVHLWQAMPPDLWMRYREARFFPDAEIAALFEELRARCDGESLEVVFDGDLFDFDVPRPNVASGTTDARTLAERAVQHLGQILDDHRVFVDAVARVLIDGHRVVFVSGNHDVQLTLPAVRRVLSERLVQAALDASDGRADPVALSEQILFRGWFHRTADGIHIEHGHQYDPYCSLRYPMEPISRNGRHLQPTMGSLVMKHLVGRLGYFNPNVDSSFLLTTREYIRHWVRYYLFSGRSLAGAWILGSCRVIAEMVANYQSPEPTRDLHHAELAAAETGASPSTLRRHAEAFALCSWRGAARMLRLDRVLLAATVAGCITLAAANPVLGAAMLALAAAGALAFWKIVPRQKLDSVYDGLRGRSQEIAALHNARAVVLGHTHKPYGYRVDGVFYGNCGTWAPMFSDVECSVPIEWGRPFIWLRSDDSQLLGGLYRFGDGALVPQVDQEPRVSGVPEAPSDVLQPV